MALAHAKTEKNLFWKACMSPLVLDLTWRDRRRWFPEMTVKALAGNNDKDLIHLLKLRLPKDQTKDDLMAPIHLPNAQFEKMIETNDHGILRLNGVQEQVWTVKVSRRITKEDKSVWRAAEQVLGKSEVKEIRRTQEKAQQGKELKACGKCKPIERIIRYCSRFYWFKTVDRDCQVADRKCGFPVPHKNICGKKGYDDDEDHIPKMIMEFPWVLKTVSDKMKFLIMRRRAMKTGDKAAVATMCKMLLPYAEKLPLEEPNSKLNSRNSEPSLVTEEEKQVGLTPMIKGLMMRDNYSGPKIHK
ncbi:hypothetical protein DFS33DRAFT_1275496 [Desarmillaria ectypa]|nr:hypothetical protein DFS33DRAFT_1275496 [Desarmillaria ectypa]